MRKGENNFEVYGFAATDGFLLKSSEFVLLFFSSEDRENTLQITGEIYILRDRNFQK